MRFSIFNIHFCLERAVDKRLLPNLNDVSCVNEETIKYLSSLSGDDIADRLSPVTFDDLSDLEEVKKRLEDYGVVVVRDFIPRASIEKISLIIDDIDKRVASFLQAGEVLREEDCVLFQRGKAKLSDYHDLSSYGKAVVQMREGQDDGMIDIFNIDKWYGQIGEILRPFFESSSVYEILDPGQEGIVAKNLNFYFNNSVTSTRGFHADSYEKKLKGFVYLSDVLSLCDGPYTYVKGSHVESPYRRINRQISSSLPNKTETPLVPLDKILPIMARKGALVISDQSGSHRGFPQSEGFQRVVAVMNFKK